MNVNGSQFHLLLGKADWGRCRIQSAGEWSTLSDAWSTQTASPPLAGGTSVLAWDVRRSELRLQVVPIELPATPGAIPFRLDARRGTSADCYGNVYWIDNDTTRLRVRSNGSQNESAFWPPADDPRADRHVSLDADFTPVPATPIAPRSYSALTVSEDNYLVVAFTSVAWSGLLVFDLMAGGPPQETLWPTAMNLRPFDMAPRVGGGIWVLDRQNARLWEFDCRLTAVIAGQGGTPVTEAEVDLFQSPARTARSRPASSFPAGIDLNALATDRLDPIAVEMLDDGEVLLLDRHGASARSRVFRLRRSGDSVRMDPPVWLDLPAHDFVLARGTVRDSGALPLYLFVATATGNQALAFDVTATDSGFALASAAELFPLRRFGGRACDPSGGRREASLEGRECGDR